MPPAEGIRVNLIPLLRTGWFVPALTAFFRRIKMLLYPGIGVLYGLKGTRTLTRAERQYAIPAS